MFVEETDVKEESILPHGSIVNGVRSDSIDTDQSIQNAINKTFTRPSWIRRERELCHQVSRRLAVPIVFLWNSQKKEGKNIFERSFQESLFHSIQSCLLHWSGEWFQIPSRAQTEESREYSMERNQCNRRIVYKQTQSVSTNFITRTTTKTRQNCEGVKTNPWHSHTVSVRITGPHACDRPVRTREAGKGNRNI